MAEKKYSLLSNMMYATRNSEFSDAKRSGIAGESNDDAKGEAKSFPFMVKKFSHGKSGITEKEHDDLLIFFENLNDIRFYVWQEIKNKLGKLEQLDDKNILLFLKPTLPNKDEFKSLDITNAWTKMIRELTAKIVKKHTPTFDHLNQGKLPYWISYDLFPKISSYLSLLKKAGGESKKNLFDTWVSDEEGNFNVNLEIFNSVCGSNLDKWNEKKAKEILIELALNSLGTNNKYFEIDKFGKIKKIQGHNGVREHNILVRQINIRLGGYLGQLTNFAVNEFSKSTAESFKSTRDVWKYLKTEKSEKLELEWNSLRNTNIKTLKEIKRYLLIVMNVSFMMLKQNFKGNQMLLFTCLVKT